jgi:hypothetical protein
MVMNYRQYQLGKGNDSLTKQNAVESCLNKILVKYYQDKNNQLDHEINDLANALFSCCLVVSHSDYDKLFINSFVLFFITTLLITTVQIRQLVILMVSTNAGVMNSDQCFHSC